MSFRLFALTATFFPLALSADPLGQRGLASVLSAEQPPSLGKAAPGANPASWLCLKLKGALQVVASSQGQLGLCRFGEARIEIWTLYRAAVEKEKTRATQAYLSAPGQLRADRRTAASYCTGQGGAVVVLKSAAGNDVRLCRFSDDSFIEESTLWRGPREGARREAVSSALRTVSR